MCKFHQLKSYIAVSSLNRHTNVSRAQHCHVLGCFVYLRPKFQRVDIYSRGSLNTNPEFPVGKSHHIIRLYLFTRTPCLH